MILFVVLSFISLDHQMCHSRQVSYESNNDLLAIKHSVLNTNICLSFIPAKTK